MFRRVPSILLAALLVSCSLPTGGAEFRPEETKRAEIVGFSVSFDVPGTFIRTEMEGGVLFAGPKGRPEYFTPLIVQPRATQANLGEVLEGLLAPLMNNPSFVMHRQEPIAVGGVLALLYELSFELHDADRRRLGVLVPTPGGVVDIALAANENLIRDAFPIFDRVLDSLVVTEREPRD